MGIPITLRKRIIRLSYFGMTNKEISEMVGVEEDLVEDIVTMAHNHNLNS